MAGEERDDPRALPSASPPSLPAAPGREPGLDWRGLWDGVKRVVGHLDSATQTPPDDVLVGKIGVITAPVSITKIGEIRLPVRGGTQDYLACAQPGYAETMGVNSTAEVVAFMPPNTVYVKPAG